MTTYKEIRHLLNVIEIDNPELNEGAIDTVKKWISGLGDSIKNEAASYLKELEQLLAAKYGATVPQEVKSANKTWMFGKLTYQNLYEYIRQLGFTDTEINQALKNPIVTNTLNRAFATLPANVRRPSLPLNVNSIQSNPGLISTMVDRKTRIYLSRVVASIIFDSLAHINATKQRNDAIQSKAASSNIRQPSDTPYMSPTYSNIPQQKADVNDVEIEKLKSAIASIRAGLATMKGASL